MYDIIPNLQHDHNSKKIGTTEKYQQSYFLFLLKVF